MIVDWGEEVFASRGIVGERAELHLDGLQAYKMLKTNVRLKELQKVDVGKSILQIDAAFVAKVIFHHNLWKFPPIFSNLHESASLNRNSADTFRTDMVRYMPLTHLSNSSGSN
jgi:uncharacterized Fe-S center protein